MKAGKREDRVRKSGWKPRLWPLLLIFLFLIIAISVSGYLYYQKQKKDVFHEQITQLQVITDLKAAEIKNWLLERMGDARAIENNPIIKLELLAFLNDRSAGLRRESIRGWMESLRNSYRYQNILLADASGKVLLALSGNYPVIGSEGLELLETARREETSTHFRLAPLGQRGAHPPGRGRAAAGRRYGRRLRSPAYRSRRAFSFP